jgi:excisionase family DNA binding protein
MVVNASDSASQGEEQLLTKPEVARLLRVRSKTIERFMSQRDLPYIKLGRLVRYERAAVEAFKQRLTVGAT